jgi:2',3'-cyclic-nucleotide 2'-phosphodiesterase (5'-nucleotidase family)
MIKGERAKSEHVLVLDAGDSLVGDQNPAIKTQGQTSVELMNRLGYDAAGIGPGDLVLGPAVLQQRIAEAKFPLLSANAVVKSNGELLAKPYVVKDVAGHRVAIVGLTGGRGTDLFEVRDPQATMKTVMGELNGQADEVILLSTAGAETDQKIADAVPGITAIISGGVAPAGEPWVSQATGTPIYHADKPSSGHTGRYLGVADLTLEPGGKLAGQKWRQVGLGPDVSDDAAMAAWVKEAETKQ